MSHTSFMHPDYYIRRVALKNNVPDGLKEDYFENHQGLSEYGIFLFKCIL